MAGHTDIINKIDENIIQARKIIDNFEVFESDKEIGKTKALRAISKILTEADYDIIKLVRDLKISPTKFEERRRAEGDVGL